MNQTHPNGPPKAGHVDRRRMMAEAIDLHRRGRFVEAERIYRRILQTEPNHPDALHLLGLIAREAGQTEAAIQLIQRAIAISPDTASFRSNLAMIYEQVGRYDDCEAA
ncbi:MAG: tetratricopeptide repeat protein, partial [Gammaproteobacteria bacterium]